MSDNNFEAALEAAAHESTTEQELPTEELVIDAPEAEKADEGKS